MHTINRKVSDIKKMVEVEIKQLSSPDFLENCKRHLVFNRRKFTDKNSDAISELLESNGIYLFWVHCPGKKEDLIDVFKNIWHKRGDTKGKYSRFNQSRASKAIEVDGWVALYLGKSKTVKTRIHQHIDKPRSDGTYAMRFSECHKKIQELKFAVSVISLDDLGESYYLCERIESSLRSCINPIIGRQ